MARRPALRAEIVQHMSVVSIIDGTVCTVIDGGERKSFPFPLPDLSKEIGKGKRRQLRRQACSRPEF